MTKRTFRQRIGRAAGWKCEFGECERENADGSMVHAHHNERQDDDSGGSLFCVDHHQQVHQEIADAMKLDGADWQSEPEMAAHQRAANILSGARRFWNSKEP